MKRSKFLAFLAVLPFAGKAVCEALGNINPDPGIEYKCNLHDKNEARCILDTSYREPIAGEAIFREFYVEPFGWVRFHYFPILDDLPKFKGIK